MQQETHNNKRGFGAPCICNKESRFLPPWIPPRSERIDERDCKSFSYDQFDTGKDTNKKHLRFLYCTRTVLLCHLRRHSFLLAERRSRVNELLGILFLLTTLYIFSFTFFLWICCLLRLREKRVNATYYHSSYVSINNSYERAKKYTNYFLVVTCSLAAFSKAFCFFNSFSLACKKL